MVITYIIDIIICICVIRSIIKAINTKDYVDLLASLLFIPFLIFFISSEIFGGSAFNDAVSSYSMYQQGHYYLSNHGIYTEVSYRAFLYMQIIEITGTISFGIAFILMIILNSKSKKAPKKKIVNGKSDNKWPLNDRF